MPQSQTLLSYSPAEEVWRSVRLHIQVLARALSLALGASLWWQEEDLVSPSACERMTMKGLVLA